MIPSLCNLSIAAPNAEWKPPCPNFFDTLSEDPLLVIALQAIQEEARTDLNSLDGLCQASHELNERCNRLWLDVLKQKKWIPRWSPDPLKPGGLFPKVYLQMVTLMRDEHRAALLKLNKPGITTIPEGAFERCISLVLTSLPNSLTTIGDDAFRMCKNLALTSLPESLETIGQRTFQDCTSLAFTSLPPNLTMIGPSAFSGCESLALTNLAPNLTMIGPSAFSGCIELKLKSLPEGLKTIGNETFLGCSKLALESLPEGLNTIEPLAFYGCTALKLTSLPEGLNTIAVNAFERCKPPILELVSEWRALKAHGVVVPPLCLQ